jgi:TPR repeat protein
VENEVPEAIFELGACYEHGYGVLSKSMKKAAKIYKRGVELGNVDSMINLGNAYLHGAGVKCDKKKTMQLWKTAAERGSAMAQAKVSTLFIESDPKEAARWMKLSAQQGFTRAESFLGRWLFKGFPGVEADLDEAKRWLARAAAKGDESAINALDEILREHP